MTVVTYEQLALGWRPDSKQDHAFNLAVVIALGLCLVLAYLFSSIPLPKEQRNTRIVVPERIAKFITEKPKPVVKKIIKPKPKPKPIFKPKFKRKKPAIRKPLTRIEKKARKKAEESGLLALTRDLSDLIDTSSLDSMVGKKINRDMSHTRAAAVNTEILTSNGGKGSGGVRQTTKGGTVGSARLDDSQRQLVRKLLAAKGKIANSIDRSSDHHDSRSRRENVRSEEDVAYVMDKHKSMLHAVYRRALRKNPGLQGKIVLEITILPSGKVSRVRIKSSELNDPVLEASLIARIKQFDFGVRAVKTLTVTMPVEFLPS